MPKETQVVLVIASYLIITLVVVLLRGVRDSDRFSYLTKQPIGYYIQKRFRVWIIGMFSAIIVIAFIFFKDWLYTLSFQMEALMGLIVVIPFLLFILVGISTCLGLLMPLVAASISKSEFD